MGEMTIDLLSGIKAVLLGPDLMYSKTSVILDPITESYSSKGLTFYEIVIVESFGISNPVILHNGKNSRFSVEGPGKVVLELTVKDSIGRSAKDTLTITIEG